MSDAPRDRFGDEYVTDEAELLHEIRDILSKIFDLAAGIHIWPLLAKCLPGL